jgi:hypothetical protein
MIYMKWQVGTIGQFYDCGESTVIYFEPAGGDTHLISDFAAHLIRLIASVPGPLGADDIIALVSKDIERDDLPALNEAIPSILSELSDLDIVVPS